MPAPVRVVIPESAPEPMDTWSRLRRNFQFAQCDDTRVRYWTGRYTRHAGVFTTQMARALPSLRYISDIILDAGLPAEFVLLPWVESNYRPLRSQSNKAAGIWQIMPATGRELGLRIDNHYDGRLDLDESTRAVARMLWRDKKMLGDWRLTDMAFNAGVYRIRQLVEGRDTPLTQAIPDLGVKHVTLDHLAKVQALACIVNQPERYNTRLPHPDSGPHLVRRSLPEVLELPVAARLAGLPTATLRELNPAILEVDQPSAALILPADSAAVFAQQYATLESFGWQQWQRIKLNKPGSLIALAHDNPERAAALARVNQRRSTETLARNSALWLPVNLVAALPEDSHVPLAGTPKSYTVHAGDSLWGIARRFNLRMSQIRVWNDLQGSLLHLGQVLLLEP